MKLLCLISVTAMALLSGGAFWIAATRPYQEPISLPLVVQETMIKCASSAGYYNEGFAIIGLILALATCVMTVAGFDYLKAKS